MPRAIFLYFCICLPTMLCSQTPVTQLADSMLYYYYDLHIRNLDIYYSEPTQDNYRAYYAPNITTPYVSINNTYLKNIDGVCLDTLEYYLNLELVDENVFKQKKHNPYAVSKPANTIVSRKDSFCLPIQTARKFICFPYEQPIEAYMGDYSFKGQIDSLNAYVVNFHFEQPSHFLIDRNTGEKLEHFNFQGVPNISPDRKYLVDLFANTATYNADESCILHISLIDENFKQQAPFLQVSFKSWMPISDEFHWVSDRAIIFKVLPVREYVEKIWQENQRKELQYQYLKLTILPLLENQ